METETKATPTPGPWRISRSGLDTTIVSDTGGPGRDDLAAIADVEPTGSWVPDIEANAHLIASAPLLLKACEAICAGVTNEELERAEKLARAAIAAARGEA